MKKVREMGVNQVISEKFPFFTFFLCIFGLPTGGNICFKGL